ncbi:MAG: pyridoxal-phosphate dependent enzyme [Flavobacteriaceae bacterium]|nr:pyridoxal-phosphate dependent enzyme [Flavobacteriaceae bacterium]
MLDIRPIENITLTPQLSLKPEFRIHPTVSGNKFRKLKYNIQAVIDGHFEGILTFGGAFSNHIAATAAAGKDLNIPTVGIIRGEELVDNLDSNPTLSYAKACGMHLEFISRAAYRQKTEDLFLQDLQKKHPNFYILPEGGTNALAIAGCKEILTEADHEFDVICCAVGTGGTISGLINSSLPHQKIIGFPALKGAFIREDICKFAQQSNWDLCHEYHFGGYAKVNLELIQFINKFKQEFKLSLDPIYTGKMMYGIFDLIQNGFFSKSAKILAIHTGGLQGIEGMNHYLSKHNLELIA